MSDCWDRHVYVKLIVTEDAVTSLTGSHLTEVAVFHVWHLQEE